MDEVNEFGQETLITKHGRPASRLVPARKSKPIMRGRYRNAVMIVGEIMSPVEPREAWDAIARPGRILGPRPESGG